MACFIEIFNSADSRAILHYFFLNTVVQSTNAYAVTTGLTNQNFLAITVLIPYWFIQVSVGVSPDDKINIF